MQTQALSTFQFLYGGFELLCVDDLFLFSGVIFFSALWSCGFLAFCLLNVSSMLHIRVFLVGPGIVLRSTWLCVPLFSPDLWVFRHLVLWTCIPVNFFLCPFPLNSIEIFLGFLCKGFCPLFCPSSLTGLHSCSVCFGTPGILLSCWLCCVASFFACYLELFSWCIFMFRFFVF